MNYIGKITDEHIELLAANKDALGLSFHEIVLLKDTQPRAVKMEKWIERLDEFYNVGWISSINDQGVNFVYEIEEVNERTLYTVTWARLGQAGYAEELKDFKRMLFDDGNQAKRICVSRRVSFLSPSRPSAIDSMMVRLKVQNTCVLTNVVH